MVKKAAFLLFFACLCLFLVSCNKDKGGIPDKITIHSGNGLSGIPGTVPKSASGEPKFLEVTVWGKMIPGMLGGKGTQDPLENVAVTFQNIKIGEGDDTVGEILFQPFPARDEAEWKPAHKELTDPGGRVRVQVKMPEKVGQCLVEAFFEINGKKKNAIFSLNSGLQLSGNQQQGSAGNILNDPCEIRIVDKDNNPIEGIHVHFSTPKGKYSPSVKPAWTVTDQNGFASTHVKLPKKYTGKVEVSAEVIGKDINFRDINFQAMSIDGKLLLFGLLGGLAIFLYGMKLMSEGLQRVAGRRMRKILAIFTKNRFVGILVGAGVTAVIQSSSATTVMLVGFVNAGLINLKQAMGVIFGANIGTTATAQIIAFKLNDLAYPAIVIGFILVMFVKNQTWKFWGQVLMGFGFLFLGLTLMGDSLKPLRGSPTFQAFFRTFDCRPETAGAAMPFMKVLGAVFIGTVLTVVVQSSSATVGLTIALASAGLINFYTAVPIILGDNIGTTITAILASLTANRRSKQAALGHTMFNLCGTMYMIALFFIKWNGEPVFMYFIDNITSGKALNVAVEEQENIARKIAMAHTFFNVFNVILFLPLITSLTKLVSRIIVVHEDEEDEVRIEYLEPHLLDTPGIALTQVWSELEYMSRLGRKSVQQAFDYYKTGESKLIEKVKHREETIDTLQHDITAYLVELSKRTLTEDESRFLPILMHCVNDLERIGDQAESILDIAERKKAQKILFSGEAEGDLEKLYTTLDYQFEHLQKVFKERSEPDAKLVQKAEEDLNRLAYEFDRNHVKRVETGKCGLRAAIMFRDMSAYIERMGDHVNNVAKRLAEVMKSD